MDLNASSNNTQEFCDVQYKYFVAPYGGKIWFSKLYHFFHRNHVTCSHTVFFFHLKILFHYCHSYNFDKREGEAAIYTSLFLLSFTEFWCNPVWDSLLCWPPTKASTTAKQRCPFVDGFDTTSKYCIYNRKKKILNIYFYYYKIITDLHILTNIVIWNLFARMEAIL